ncbi:MAG TPA: BMP family ABC transporter substrate-binding protein [Ignavibacteria bacterium]|nr:BMP family ABC transporter substrate-binding protein [Ignavibacteria bacterium]
MKNFRIFFLFLILSVLFASCNKKQESDTSTQKKSSVKIGLVFDVGGKGDKSFNDAAYRGLERAKRDLGIDFEVIDPGAGEDRESALRKLASKPDVGLIFGVGFIFTDDITQMAKDFPDKKFACIDYTVNASKEIPSNLLALEFKEEEGSFLVGALAAYISKTGKIGFIGGMESPLIKKFETGYINGAKYANKDVKVLSAYVGVTGEGFKNSAKAKEIALTQYNNGADIIYHASGLSGIGVFEAAKEMKKLVIGVDLDQYAEAPGYVLTSMTKQVDEMVYQSIVEFVNNKFMGGIKNLGLKEKGVNYVYDANNQNLIPKDIYDKIEAIRQKIMNGEIKVMN